MSKAWKMLIITVMVLGLTGCGKGLQEASAQGATRFVVRVDVDGRHQSKRIQRSYDSQEKMVAVLNCMRLLRSLGPAESNPGMLAGNGFDVWVWYSDGDSGIYRLRAEQYLSKDSGAWQLVDPRQAQCLPPLLESMPSDQGLL